MNKYPNAGVLFFVILSCISFGCESRPKDENSKQQQILQGRELYISNGCAVCHGASGDGKGAVARSSRITPTNFHDPKTYRHGTDRVSIQTVIENGVKDETSIMPSFQHLNRVELEALSQYLLSLQKQEQQN